MNVLDNMVLIILVAVFLFYCHKKGKFPFRRKNETVGAAEKTGTMPNAGQSYPDLAVSPQMFAQGAQGFASPCALYSQGIQALQGNAQTITLCRLIPWTFRFNPLPFSDGDVQTATADNVVNSDVTPLGAMLESEINSLNADGYTVLGINAVSLPLGDNAVRALFFITCTGGGTP